MSFFEKVGGTISSKSKDVAKKAKEMAEIAGLNGKISAQEEIIRRNYLEIGKAVFEKYKDGASEDFSEQCEKIEMANTEIDKIKDEILIIKNAKLCPNCGAEVVAENTFCPGCGSAMAEQ